MFHGVSIESFIAGFAYGGTTVIVGQPFETLKTLTQLSSSSGIRPSIITTAKELYTSSGIKGFYRGGTPLLIGGGLMRSAQFGFYNSVLPFMDTKFGKRTPDQYWFGCINPHVVAAGWAGGIGAGLRLGFTDVMDGKKLPELHHYRGFKFPFAEIVY